MTRLNESDRRSKKGSYESFTGAKDARTILGISAAGAMVTLGIATGGNGSEAPRQAEYAPADFGNCEVVTVEQGNTASDIVEEAARTISERSDMYLRFDDSNAIAAIQHPDSKISRVHENGSLQPAEEYNICLTSDGKAVNVTPVK